MSTTRIHKDKQPRRPHFLKEWMATREGLIAADLAREIGADKSLVSRWLDGSTPGVEYQKRLAEFFHIEPESLFRHPDDDWLTRFFRGRPREEVEHIKKSMETTFPKKVA